MHDSSISSPSRSATAPATLRIGIHRLLLPSALLLCAAPCSEAHASTPPKPIYTQSAPSHPDLSPQKQAPKENQDQNQNQIQDQGEDETLPTRNPQTATVAENIATAWSMLTTAVTNAKHTQHRIQALAAIGTLGPSPRAEKMLTTALDDTDLDVRTAAILAAGQSHDRNLIAALRRMLDDPEPQVAFTAAITLWKRNDHSGEDILMAVVDGERHASASLLHGSMHTANEGLHNPSTLARLGALQGASMLLGPFGFGITAFEYIHKNGGDIARALAIEQIAQEKTTPIRNALVAALDDKDPTVRAAAAKALGEYRDHSVAKALSALFDDPKLPVRLTAAAAYLRATGAAPGVPIARSGTNTP
jgi:HEAT repeats